MSQQYDNNNSGALFKNDKQGNESRPDYRGSAEVDGIHYWVSAWVNTSKKDGSKFMSLKFQAKDEQPRKVAPGQTKAAPRTAMQPAHDDFDDDPIPF